MLPTQQGQSFIPAASQQFRPVGQGISSSNVGMPTIPNQQVQFSQPMQQFPPRLNQPVHAVPSSQAIQGPYVQTNRPLTAGSPQSQHPAPTMSNQMPGLGVPGMSLSSSYTVRSHCPSSLFFWSTFCISFDGFALFQFVPSSYGQPQNNVSGSSQFQPMPQMHAPVAGQSWVSSANHSAPLVAPVQQSGQQPSAVSSTDTVSILSY